MNTALLNEILKNQREHWVNVVTELLDGKKQTHWCWCFLPNVPGLGKSEQSQHFALEPQTFLDFITNSSEYRGNLMVVIDLIDRAYQDGNDKDLTRVLGEVDALKFRSFMTMLFMVHLLDDDLLFTFPRRINRIIRDSPDVYGICEDTRLSVLKHYDKGNI